MVSCRMIAARSEARFLERGRERERERERERKTHTHTHTSSDDVVRLLDRASSELTP